MTSANNNPWTLDENHILTGGMRAGWSISTLEKALPGRSARAIQNRAARLGVFMSLTGRPNKGAATLPAGTDGEILRLCSYIRSDSNIAEYMGVDVERVARVRRRLPPATTRGDVGLTDLAGPALRITRDRDTETASDKLRDRMLAVYRAQAARERTDVTTAMISLLYGARAAANFTKQGAH